MVETWLRRARAAWPAVEVPDAAFRAAWAARQGDGDPPGSVDALHGVDLYLAVGCALGDPGAVAAFEATHIARTACMQARDRVLAAGVVDDVRLPQVQTQIGMLAYREGRFADALAAFEANVRTYQRMFGDAVSSIDTMRDNVGWTLIELGRAAEAVPILEGVVARQPWGDAWNALGMAHRALGELPAARRRRPGSAPSARRRRWPRCPG